MEHELVRGPAADSPRARVERRARDVASRGFPRTTWSTRVGRVQVTSQWLAAERSASRPPNAIAVANTVTEPRIGERDPRRVRHRCWIDLAALRGDDARRDGAARCGVRRHSL